MTSRRTASSSTILRATDAASNKTSLGVPKEAESMKMISRFPAGRRRLCRLCDWPDAALRWQAGRLVQHSSAFFYSEPYSVSRGEGRSSTSMTWKQAQNAESWRHSHGASSNNSPRPQTPTPGECIYDRPGRRPLLTLDDVSDHVAGRTGVEL